MRRRAVRTPGRAYGLRLLRLIHRAHALGCRQRGMPRQDRDVRPLVGHHLVAQQVHTAYGQVAQKVSSARHGRCGGSLPCAKPVVAHIQRTNAHTRRLVLARAGTAGGRPVGAAAAKHALCRQAAHALFPHCAARRLRPQVRGYRGRVRRQRYNGFRGCSVVESGAYAPRIGAHGQERSARSMAACRAVHARRRELRTLPQGFRGADTLGRDALRRDVQRLGGILRHRRRRAPRRHAADDGLRHLLRVPQGRRSAPVGGCRAGRRICSRDNDMRRAVAIRDRRRGKDYLRQTVQSKGRRPYAPIYQRLRRGGRGRERRAGAYAGGRGVRMPGRRVHRRTAIHDYRRRRGTPVVCRVQAPAARYGGVRRQTRRGAAADQLRLRCQAQQHAGSG